jgi:hypothetical protein
MYWRCVSGPLNRFVQALSLLLVLAAFMGITAAAIPEMAETFIEGARQTESTDEVLPDFTPPSPPNPIEARTTELSASTFITHDDFRTGIYPEILTPPPLQVRGLVRKSCLPGFRRDAISGK